MCNINYNMYIILNLFHFYLALCFVSQKFIDRVHRKCAIYFVSPYWRHTAGAPLCSSILTTPYHQASAAHPAESTSVFQHTNNTISPSFSSTPRRKHPCVSTVLPRKRQSGQKNVPGWRTGHRPVIPDGNILHDLSFSGRTGNTGVLRRGLRRTAHLLFREEQETSHIQSSSLRLGIRLNSLVLCVTTMRSLASPCAAICIS